MTANTRWKLLFPSLLLFLSAPSLAQMESCAIYEQNGISGYGVADIQYFAQHWQTVGSVPEVPDFNNDGIANILDLVQQTNCTMLAPGLMGFYYGYDTGAEGQTLDFPDFNAITREPTVIRPTHQFEEFQGWDGYLNSDMRSLFAAAYTGYLFVPEEATYTIQISGRQGARFFLNGTEEMAFDGWPWQGEQSFNLTAGFHPVRIETYVVANNGEISLAWSSTGNTIPSSPVTIGPDYLFHAYETVTSDKVTGLELLCDPPSGDRQTGASERVDLWTIGPNPNFSLRFNNSGQILLNGVANTSLNLSPGLNSFPYRLSDDEGRVLEGTYHLYRDTENITNNGLAVNLYSLEWYENHIPFTDHLMPFETGSATGTQLIPDSQNRIFFNDNLYMGEQSVVELVGTIQVTTAGDYTFRLSGDGGVYINGELVVGISNDYVAQYNNQATVYLKAGRHHYRMRSSRVGQAPRARLYWTPPGGTEELVPDSVFGYGASHVAGTPDFGNSQASGSRVAGGQVVEYLFEADAPFADSSGWNFDLIPDPRAIIRATGGITYQSTGGLSNEQAGVHLGANIRRNEAFSIEVDFMYYDNADWHERRVLGLSGSGNEGPGTPVAVIYTKKDDIYFTMTDQDGNERSCIAEGRLVQDGRNHVVGTWDGAIMRIYVNGGHRDLESFDTSTNPIAEWPSLLKFDAGQANARRRNPGTWGWQMKGTLLAAAAYDRALTQEEIEQNRVANIALNPSVNDDNFGPTDPYPPAGATAAQLDEAFHIQNRLSFGPSPEVTNDIITNGAQAWINAQLDPDTIDDSQLEEWLETDMFIPMRYPRDLQGETVFRMAHSKRQLLEVMTQFWENHFNTQFQKVRDLTEEYEENQRFRELALGRFEDLLMASATNYPMTVYLDSNTNVVGAANENYGREIMELHTMGANNGYTQDDIVEVSRCFTGWTVRNGDFYFDPGLHDYSEKTPLGMTLPAGGGMSDGLAVIRHLAARTETADFISWKLCQLFIADDPPADVVAAASAAYQANDGSILAVLNAILNHARFRTDLTYRNNKIKTPLEFAISLCRATETPAIGNSLTFYINDMGMELFNYVDPTGFDEASEAWMDTNSLLNRWNLVNELTTNRLNANTPTLHLKKMAQRYSFDGYVGILDFFENLTTHGTEAAGTRAIMESWLTDDNPGGWIFNDDVLDGRVRQTLGLYFRLPEFNKQ